MVGLWSEDDGGSPRTFARTDPIVMTKGVNLCEHDLALVDAITGLAATDGRGFASVDAKFEAEDGADNAVFVEAVPVFVDGVDEVGAQLIRDVIRDGDVFVELGLVADCVPEVDVGTAGHGFRGRCAG